MVMSLRLRVKSRRLDKSDLFGLETCYVFYCTTVSSSDIFITPVSIVHEKRLAGNRGEEKPEYRSRLRKEFVNFKGARADQGSIFFALNRIRSRSGNQNNYTYFQFFQNQIWSLSGVGVYQFFKSGVTSGAGVKISKPGAE